ncbi:MAG: hypothetical protein L0H73_13985, partial [Nitrococcus sp.]|nr:hypothetical protein [Nitrococcus sp.]
RARRPRSQESAPRISVNICSTLHEAFPTHSLVMGEWRLLPNFHAPSVMAKPHSGACDSSARIMLPLPIFQCML